MRYPLLLQPIQQVLASDQENPLIMMLDMNGDMYLSIKSTTEVRQPYGESTANVTAIGFNLGSDIGQEEFESDKTSEFNIDSKNPELDGQATSVQQKSFGTFTDNVVVMIEPNEMLFHPATNQAFVKIVNGEEVANFFGTWPHK